MPGTHISRRMECSQMIALPRRSANILCGATQKESGPDLRGTLGVSSDNTPHLFKPFTFSNMFLYETEFRMYVHLTCVSCL